LIEKIAHLPFQGEGGSINEGYADFFASFCRENPLLGENSYKTAPYKRSVETSVKFSEANGGLYHDSAIVSGVFWKLRSVISEDKIINLAMKTLNRLGPDADLNLFKLNLSEQAAGLFTGEELDSVNKVLKEVELL
jgi:Zn-dependent metalloprotease